jgi:hypothetical protein
MADNKPNQEEKPFDEETSSQWIDTVTAWKWRTIGEKKYKISGNCPRCGHHMQEIVGYQIGVFKLAGPRKTVWVQCNCSVKHPGAPDGPNEGCGQGAEIPLANNIVP